MHKSNTHSGKTGFTLAEILMAMMVFAIAISTILALLARSIETADSILIKDEVISLSSSLDSFMAELPFYDSASATLNPDDPDAYKLVRDQRALFAYQYRGNLTVNPRSDSSLVPIEVLSDTDKLGESYTVVPGVRPAGNSLLEDDIDALEGRLFLINLRVSDANPIGTTLVPDPNAPNGTVPAYNSAVLVVLAEFYQVAPVLATDSTAFQAKMAEINNTNVSLRPNPVFSFNFAVRR
jgi:prepilin-type N-terminal cleavage/methylation domain-containing protein